MFRAEEKRHIPAEFSYLAYPGSSISITPSLSRSLLKVLKDIFLTCFFIIGTQQAMTAKFGRVKSYGFHCILQKKIDQKACHVNRVHKQVEICAWTRRLAVKSEILDNLCA